MSPTFSVAGHKKQHVRGNDHNATSWSSVDSLMILISIKECMDRRRWHRRSPRRGPSSLHSGGLDVKGNKFIAGIVPQRLRTHPWWVQYCCSIHVRKGYTNDDTYTSIPWKKKHNKVWEIRAIVANDNTRHEKLSVWSLTLQTEIKLWLTPFLLLHYVTALWCLLISLNIWVTHVIDNSSSDDSDINREIKALFTRTNVLCRRFSRCSLAAKVRLFRTYCICFYDTALWSNFTIGTFNRFSCCYSKCIKCFFRIPKV